MVARDESHLVGGRNDYMKTTRCNAPNRPAQESPPNQTTSVLRPCLITGRKWMGYQSSSSKGDRRKHHGWSEASAPTLTLRDHSPEIKHINTSQHHQHHCLYQHHNHSDKPKTDLLKDLNKSGNIDPRSPSPYHKSFPRQSPTSVTQSQIRNSISQIDQKSMAETWHTTSHHLLFPQTPFR
jgi:hypothetical protein